MLRRIAFLMPERTPKTFIPKALYGITYSQTQATSISRHIANTEQKRPEKIIRSAKRMTRWYMPESGLPLRATDALWTLCPNTSCLKGIYDMNRITPSTIINTPIPKQYTFIPKIIIRIIKSLLISPSPADRGDGDGLPSYRCQEELYEITV